MRSKGQTNFKKAFGEALDAHLSVRRMSQSDLAEKTNRSVSYVNRTMTGTRFISPEWANTVALALGLTEEETKRLHTAAAIDVGYKLDLTKK